MFDIRTFAETLMKDMMKQVVDGDEPSFTAYVIGADEKMQVVCCLELDERTKASAMQYIKKLAVEDNAVAVLVQFVACYREKICRNERVLPGQLQAEGAAECLMIVARIPGTDGFCLRAKYSKEGGKVAFKPVEEIPKYHDHLIPDWTNNTLSVGGRQWNT